MTRPAAAVLLLCAMALAGCAPEPGRQSAVPEVGRTSDLGGARSSCIAAVAPLDCRRKSDLSGNSPFGALGKGDGAEGGISGE